MGRRGEGVSHVRIGREGSSSSPGVHPMSVLRLSVHPPVLSLSPSSGFLLQSAGYAVQEGTKRRPPP